MMLNIILKHTSLSMSFVKIIYLYYVCEGIFLRIKLINIDNYLEKNKNRVIIFI